MPIYSEPLLPIGGGGDTDWCLVRGRDVSIPSPIKISSFGNWLAGSATLITTSEPHRLADADVVTIVTNFTSNDEYNGEHIVDNVTTYTFTIEKNYVPTTAVDVRFFRPPITTLADEAIFLVDEVGDGDQTGTRHVTALTMKDYMGGSSGSTLTIEEEGSALSTDATTLNFVGSSVTASGAGTTKTITITDSDTTDHTSFSNIGTNTHAQIDTHLALTNEHIDWSASGAGTIHATNYTGSVTVTDDSSFTDYPIVFHDESNGLLDDTGALLYNPNSGNLTVPHLKVFPQKDGGSSGGVFSGLNIDLDRTGNVSFGGNETHRTAYMSLASSGATNCTVTNVLLQGDLTSDDPSVNSKDTTNYGIQFDIDEGTTSYGLHLSLTNQIDSYGIYIDNVDGQIDYKSVSSANPIDYFTIATTIAGATTLATEDGTVGATGHITLDADGDVILDCHTGRDILIQENGGTYTPTADTHVATKKYVDDENRYEYEYKVCNYNSSTANISYLPLAGYLLEQTSLSLFNSEYVSMIMPHDGIFYKIFWRPYAAQSTGSKMIVMYRGGNGDTHADTEEYRTRISGTAITANTTYENEIGVTTSPDLGFGDNTFSAGDIISIGFDPSQSPGDVKCTVVLRYDMNT